MTVKYGYEDLILEYHQDTTDAENVINKYDSFLESLSPDKYSFQREAIREVLKFFLTGAYSTIEELALENYQENKKIRDLFPSKNTYLDRFDLKDKKAVNIDLATGTGKSWVLFGLAQIMLAEGIVDRVLVLCPSLTIEEGLLDKFKRLAGDPYLTQILKELGASYPNPGIKTATDAILEGDICIENIHAAYERTGSSIETSLKGRGAHTLVLNDEAHHIYSGAERGLKKWLEFLQNENYGFHYIAGCSGTPYLPEASKDQVEYFTDIVYRYGINKAMEENVVKKVDYKEEEDLSGHSYEESYQNHQEMIEEHGDTVKPLSIVVTESIAGCVKVWDELVEFIADKEDLDREHVEPRVIWVASGVPGGKDGEAIKDIVSNPASVRKENLQLLKTVDDSDNPVEWIVSVSMLTEGWDVQNVFQVVPHERRAFNSRLLISQVLGRGLRIPEELEPPVYVRVNNHQSWTEEIKNLYEQVLEIEDRLTSKYFEKHADYAFPLYNLDYKSETVTVETKRKPADEPEKVEYRPQQEEVTKTSRYSVAGTRQYLIQQQDFIPIKQAAREIKIFLKEKDSEISSDWPIVRIENFIRDNLIEVDGNTEIISTENLALTKQAFGPMFRKTGEQNPREKLVANTLQEISLEDIRPQTVSEAMLKRHSNVFFTETSEESFEGKEKELFDHYIEGRENYEEEKKILEKHGHSLDEIGFLKDNLHEVEIENFPCPQNILIASYKPEFEFSRQLFTEADLFDGFFKNTDRGFYSFPYSYKPSTTGKTHPRHENFNPDFFLKLADGNEVLVVEIKSEGDDSNKNRAKNRDGKNHFETLNGTLEEEGINWKYHFYFLSPEDYPNFFQAIKDGEHQNWKSGLMFELESSP